MDGFTISNANKFLETGSLDNKIIKADPSLSSKDAGPSFADTLKEAVGNVNQLHLDSDKKMQELSTGRTDDIAGVMLAAEKADIALRAMVQVRNKIIDAYQEIMKMQV
ncbi:MAG: flagellar hook-basal body complex protein FliE [Bdellovibrio sp.]|nr:flagellar hook-basal body complex protein FliE [Bdellovibrio sp.]